MKILKKFFILLIFVISVLFTLTACDKDTSKTKITKEQLVGIWETDKYDIIDVGNFGYYSPTLIFNDKGEMNLYSNSVAATDITESFEFWYNYSIDSSSINIESMNYEEYTYNRNGEILTVYPNESAEDYIPKRISIESDGKLKYELKDGNTLYFTKTSDTTDLEFKAKNTYEEIKEKSEELIAVKNATREFAKKYFEENSIKAEEVDYTKDEISQKFSETECVFKTEDEKYIYIIDKDYCYVNDDYIEYAEEYGDMTRGVQCKYTQIDNYIITDLEEYTY